MSVPREIADAIERHELSPSRLLRKAVLAEVNRIEGTMADHRDAELYREAQASRAMKVLGLRTRLDLERVLSGPQKDQIHERLRAAGALDENGKLIPLYEPQTH